jgi:hypothetical protein
VKKALTIISQVPCQFHGELFSLLQVTCRSRDEQARDASDCGGDPFCVGCFVSLAVPCKVLLFLGVITSWGTLYLFFVCYSRPTFKIPLVLTRCLLYCEGIMIENETTSSSSQSSQNPEDAYNFATKAAAVMLAGAAVVGIGSAVENGIKNADREHSVRADWGHDQAIINEIDTKSNQLYIPSEESNDSMVGYIPVIGEKDLYGSVLSLVPDEDEKNDFVQFTVLESSKAQGVYQPSESFGLFSDTIDGESTYIVRQIDNSQANTYVEDPGNPSLLKPAEDKVVETLPTPETH